MKILFPYLARWKAVNWTRYHSLLTQLAKQGHKVHVIQPPPLMSEETNWQEIDVDLPNNLVLHEAPIRSGIWQHRFPADKFVKKAYYTHAIRQLVKTLITREKIDVMLVYNPLHYPLIQKNACPVVFDYADDYVDMLRNELKPSVRAPILRIARILLNRMIRAAEIRITISSILAEQFPGRFHILPNGADPEALDGVDGTAIRSRYRTPIVGFIGAFEYFINFDMILKAAEELPEVTFLLVGYGRQWRKVAEQVRSRKLNNVVLTGGIPHGEVFHYISAMHICLNIFADLPVSHGACPIKLFEYLAIGKPVISSRLKEILRIDEGFLYFADDAVSLVKTIREILKDPDIARARAEKGREAVRNQYNWDALARRFLSFLAE